MKIEIIPNIGKFQTGIAFYFKYRVLKVYKSKVTGKWEVDFLKL